MRLTLALDIDAQELYSRLTKEAKKLKNRVTFPDEDVSDEEETEEEEVAYACAGSSAEPILPQQQRFAKTIQTVQRSSMTTTNTDEQG